MVEGTRGMWLPQDSHSIIVVVSFQHWYPSRGNALLGGSSRNVSPRDLEAHFRSVNVSLGVRFQTT